MNARIHSKWRKRNRRLAAGKRPTQQRRVGVSGVESLEERRLLAIDVELNFLGQTGGLPFPTNAVAPPDPIIDVGTNHVVHAVNHGTFGSSITIYDKNNGQLVRGPFGMSTLANAGTACGAGIGDPVILFDHMAKRWLAGEFAIGPNDDNHMCLYISNTDDPTQGWVGYDIPTQLFPDYPKISVWPDAYYLTTNEATGTPPNVPAVYAIDRENMLRGLPLRPTQRFVGPALAGFEFQSFAAADLDGPRPPRGTPNLMMRHVDDELHGPVATAQDRLEIWEFRADFDNPTRSSFQLVQTVATRDFDSDFGPFPQDAIEQPGITDLPDQLLDAISEVVMNQLKYRNFGTHEVLLGSHTVDVTGNDLAGVHWFELRRAPGGQWTLFQEGTVAHPDPHDRWLPSPAMNGDQTIAIGYAISSSSLSPSMRLDGRVRTDPLGVLTQGERVIVQGSGFEESGRFGDYFSMVVDPIDDFTFWLVGEFANNGGWGTQLVKFHIDSPGDTEPPPPTAPGQNIQGLVFHDVDGDGTQDTGEFGLAGFLVFADFDEDGRLDLNEPAVRSTADGSYRLPPLPADTYQVRQLPPPSWRQTFPANNQPQSVTIDADGVTPGSADFGNTGGDLRDFGNDLGNKQTMRADNGARHGILRGFQLGATVDGEADARATDVNDGVTFTGPLIAGQTGTANVTISTGGQPRGLLQAFIDFNQDGDWSDAGEKIVSDLRLGAGTHTVTFQVPANALTGPTEARFRYGWERGLGPNGEALVGEVEDYVVNVFGDAPQAIDDSFTVPQDPEDPVTLNVLANDFASSAGNLRIRSVTAPNRGGTVTIAVDGRTVLYTPAPNFFGTETFTYTVTDDSGKIDVGLVTVFVEPTFDAPQAIDDQAFAAPGSVQPVAVLENDILGANPPTRITAITQGPANGTARIETNGTADPTDDVIIYQSDSTFVGVEQFVYRITDAVGASSEATVTVFVGDTFSDDIIRYSLLFTDLNGQPISQIEVGETFVMTVLVADIRTNVPVDERGAFAAFLDVLYPAALVSLENGLVFNGDYTAVPVGDTDVPGILDETGAFRQVGELPPGPGNKVLYRAAFRANTTGVATFLTDPADDVLDPGPPPVLGNHDTLIYFPTSAVPIEDITYLGNFISIISSAEGEAQHNFYMANDVNGDTRVTPFDALVVLTQLRGVRGEAAGEGELVGIPTAGKKYFYDTTNDGQISARDVLSVVRYLTTVQSRSYSEGEGESVFGLAPSVFSKPLDTKEIAALPAGSPVIQLFVGPESRRAEVTVSGEENDEQSPVMGAAREMTATYDHALRELASDADDDACTPELEDVLAEIAASWKSDIE